MAKRGTPVLLTVTNLLPNRHILPVDPTIMAGPNGLWSAIFPTNRIATHLHGGSTPWFSDGTPFQWFTPHRKTRRDVHERAGLPRAAGHRNLLLSERSERSPGLVPRSRDRHHAAERLCRHRLGLHHHG